MTSPDVLSPLGVRADDLTIGSTYFSVSYVDTRCTIPIVESLVFVGRDLDGECNGSLYFQDAESWATHGPFPEAASDAVTLTVTEAKPPPNLFRLDGVLDELSRCLKRRRQNPDITD